MYTPVSLLQLLSFIDLTSLEATDHEKSLMTLIYKANQGHQGVHPAAVCVYPNFGKFVADHLQKPIQTAIVAGSFPSGQTFTAAKISELTAIENLPVQEVDIVINRGAFLAGNYTFVADEIQQMRNAVPSKKLKVILETGELKSADLIRKASELAIEAGADFIKTSTGKCNTGATPEAAEIMCGVIAVHFKNTGKRIGFKPSGGIRRVEDAALYVEIVRNKLGPDWLTPDLFRIGASSLYDTLIAELENAGNR